MHDPKRRRKIISGSARVGPGRVDLLRRRAGSPIGVSRAIALQGFIQDTGTEGVATISGLDPLDL